MKCLLISLEQRWSEFVREVDPDIITGYNIQNFDFPYLLNRAAHMKLGQFSFLGRIKDMRSTIRESMLQSRQMGKRENKIINIEGRVQFDLLQVSVKIFLNARKLFLAYHVIYTFQPYCHP